ncbi:hypothetical protein PCL_01483 [Purpureocillium lilacinum]|uniref:Uncharacterized protein n=1 Tax=Purpureocillium lilacinum TaxID=33203 RepID=A0A2U3E3M0_PURLI|nr:hypothetical protein PCL_01483 [Purpureocillium lilacinum]
MRLVLRYARSVMVTRSQRTLETHTVPSCNLQLMAGGAGQPQVIARAWTTHAREQVTGCATRRWAPPWHVGHFAQPHHVIPFSDALEPASQCYAA